VVPSTCVAATRTDAVFGETYITRRDVLEVVDAFGTVMVNVALERCCAVGCDGAVVCDGAVTGAAEFGINADVPPEQPARVLAATAALRIPMERFFILTALS
jgi:hypothetical protein